MAAECVTTRGRHRCPRWIPQDTSEIGMEQAEGPRHLTPLEKLTSDMSHDDKTVRDLTVGRRIGFYKVLGEIGCGNFSRVKLGIHTLTKDKVAIKILDKTRLDQKTQRLLTREISSMEGLLHPNIVRLYEVVETVSRLHLVMEYAGGGDLHTMICTEGRLSDIDSKIAFAQILSAVKHIHERGIVHRDLKAENVLYTCTGCVKVADFGFSTASRPDEKLATFCGSPPYAAPELFRNEQYVGTLVDVWALGVLLFFMVTGSMPFRADTVPKLKRLVLDGEFTVPPWVPVACGRLIQGLLQPQPTHRWAPDQAIGCEWLLPVEVPQWAGWPPQLEPLHLAGGGELGEEELEVKEGLEALGITAEHIRNNRSGSITGVYRILLHHAHGRRVPETLPTVMHLTSDPKRDRLRAYRHTSKLCTVS